MYKYGVYLTPGLAEERTRLQDRLNLPHQVPSDARYTSSALYQEDSPGGVGREGV